MRKLKPGSRDGNRKYADMSIVTLSPIRRGELKKLRIDINKSNNAIAGKK